MCTAIVSIDPSSPCPVLLVGVRDEFAQRPWLPPDRHWPDRPALIGGRDLQAGGAWPAVGPPPPRPAPGPHGAGPPPPGAPRPAPGGRSPEVARPGHRRGPRPA